MINTIKVDIRDKENVKVSVMINHGFLLKLAWHCVVSWFLGKPIEILFGNLEYTHYN